jgi:hypothetical protein
MTSGPGPRQTAKPTNVTRISNGLSIAAKLLRISQRQNPFTGSTGGNEFNFEPWLGFGPRLHSFVSAMQAVGYRNIAVTPAESRESGTAWLLETTSEWILQSRQL